MQIYLKSTVLAAVMCMAMNSSNAFTMMPNRISHSTLSSSTTTTTSLNMALTHKEILARARKAIGQPEEEEDDEPQIFSDQVLDDMKNVLTTLEKRVKNGPGSITSDEINSLNIMTARILEDMDVNKDGAAPAKTGGPVELQAQVKAAAVVSTPVPAPVPAPASTEPVVQQTQKYTEIALKPAAGPEISEHNDEEGAAYEGKGGLGLASGTANTWIIDGMDEMTGEEYRAALQASVSARQTNRRESGTTGNMSSNSYLDNL